MIFKAKVSDRGQITLPHKVRESMNIPYGSELLLIPEANSITIRVVSTPKKKSIMHLYGSVKPPQGKSTDPEIAIEAAKKYRAKELAKKLHI